MHTTTIAQLEQDLKRLQGEELSLLATQINLKNQQSEGYQSAENELKEVRNSIDTAQRQLQQLYSERRNNQ